MGDARLITDRVTIALEEHHYKTSKVQGRVPPGAPISVMQWSDAVLLGACTFFAHASTVHPIISPYAGLQALAMAFASSMTVLTLHLSGAYRSILLEWMFQLRRIGLALAVGFVAFWSVMASGGYKLLTAGLTAALTWLAIGGVLLGIQRIILISLTARLRSEGRLTYRIALLGSGEPAEAFLRAVRAGARSGIEVVGLYDDDVTPANWSFRARMQFRGGLQDLVVQAQNGAVDAVVIGGSPSGGEPFITRAARRLQGCAIDIYQPFEPALAGARPIELIGGVPVAILVRRPLSDWQYLQKLLFDRIVAALLLVALAPLLLVVCGLIRLDSRGPVLFRQSRIGLNDKLFTCLKFRTMYHHMEDMLADRQTIRNDPRVTKVGRTLRRLSLDELPQLFNVLVGHMSLVGPRPHAPNTKAGGKLFAELLPDYAARHRVKPGITGWAQVNGWRGETVTVTQLERRVEHDIYYIENWSLRFDLYILILTAIHGFTDPRAF